MTGGEDDEGEHAAGQDEEDIIEDVRIAAMLKVGEDDDEDCLVTIMMTEGDDHESYTITIMTVE